MVQKRDPFAADAKPGLLLKRGQFLVDLVTFESIQMLEKKDEIFLSPKANLIINSMTSRRSQRFRKITFFNSKPGLASAANGFTKWS